MIGAAFVLYMQGARPYALCFVVDAVNFVVMEELIPGFQRVKGHIDTVTMTTMPGFTVRIWHCFLLSTASAQRRNVKDC